MPELSSEEIQQIEQMISAAVHDPAVPKLYVNGFHLGQTASDIFVVMLLAGKPAGVQYMSFTAAKTLMMNLQQVVGNIEAKTGQPILTMDEVQLRMTTGDKK